MEDLTSAPDAVLNVQDSSTKGNGNNFWKGLLRTILGITIFIILTFGTNGLIQQHRKAKDRKMTAMMVMSNIESFARTLEKRSNYMARNDSIAAWLLCMSYEDLELLPEKELDDLISQATTVSTLNHDHTAENIFTYNIDTWKNLNNVYFIDNVGSCFSAINGVEEQFNQWAKGVPEAIHDVQVNPDQYEGSTIHNRRCWLSYAATTTTVREKGGEGTSTPPDVHSFYTSAYTLDNLTSLTHLTDRIKELKAGKELFGC